MATTTRLDDLLLELCEEVGLDPEDPSAGAGVFTIEGVLVAVGETEDESLLDVRVVLQTEYDILEDIALLRQLAFHGYEVQADADAVRFGIAPETGELTAMLLVPVAEIGTGAELLWLLEMACEVAEDQFAELCALAIGEVAALLVPEQPDDPREFTRPLDAVAI